MRLYKANVQTALELFNLLPSNLNQNVPAKTCVDFVRLVKQNPHGLAQLHLEAYRDKQIELTNQFVEEIKSECLTDTYLRIQTFDIFEQSNAFLHCEISHFPAEFNRIMVLLLMPILRDLRQIKKPNENAIQYVECFIYKDGNESKKIEFLCTRKQYQEIQKRTQREA